MQGWKSKKKSGTNAKSFKQRRRLTPKEQRERGAKADANQVEAKALWLIASRDHSEGELRRKLSQRGFPLEHIDTVIARFKTYGYIEDVRIAGRFASSLMRSGWGPSQIRAKMMKRSFGSEQIDGALDEIFEEHGEEVWVGYARDRLKTKFNMPPHQIPAEERLKAKRHLAYRGYGGSVLRDAFEPDEEEETPA